MDDIQSTPVDFIIECHGHSSMPCDFALSTVVSTQWIRSCLDVCVYVINVSSLVFLIGRITSNSDV